MNNNKPVKLIGDCDSPGFNAKYGTYTMMDSSNNKIINFSVVHVGTVANSSHMEKKGLMDCIEALEHDNVTIGTIATDRHIQIWAYMKKHFRSDISHQFDIWHVGKNIKKKLTTKSLKKDCNDLGKWIKSIINHFWWCCATCEGNEIILL